MSFTVKTTWHASDNPNTIYAVLKRKLGREPTNAELRDDVQRILTDVMVERAGKGRLPWQRKGS